MKISRFVSMFVLIVALIALSVFQDGYDAAITEIEQQKRTPSQVEDVSFAQDTVLTDNISDNYALYINDDPYDVVTMYLTVRKGNAAEGTDHTWKEINSYSDSDYKDMGVDRYKVAGLLQVGDENGPSFGELGYGETAPNATVNIRGQTSTRYDQKNYKIEIKDNKGDFRGQTTIALNKHEMDGLRFRNKLCFDLMTGIDQMMSLRTQFVHLYVNDLTDGTDDGFEDYGLYTQVEQLNKTALKVHGLNKSGYLYKINYFEFYRYEDAIKNVDDPDFDLDLFETYMEIKGSNDNTKLIKMIEDVNDYTIPIDTILEKYFNIENLTYWMAFQILTGNVDTSSRNFYLYSPVNNDTWYILSWDCDDSFMVTEREMRDVIEFGGWQMGISNYWGNVLFQRCLKSDKFRAALDAAIRDELAYMTPERLRSMVESYSKVVKPYVYTGIDSLYTPLTSEQYDTLLNIIPDEPQYYYQEYLKSLEQPQPFYIGEITYENGILSCGWDPSYDFDSETITYTVKIARDYNLNDVIATYEGVWTTISEQIQLDPGGQYFISITATNESGYSQGAFDYYIANDSYYYGMKSFFVNLDGSITEDTYVEE
ncbi:spore coat protein H [Butyrivibrio fibrisolvens DSM 3071]|uniref:Spore coat protein H n=1 Tax=Butyrivibrio fibrisolvens DSM 3071 TaxID=1121131 RepID=A0A1M6FSB2_BUTFI|nr:CotH kinase family protein [Butyrivibrio fibrisolvens]SHJ00543.1 spore coat protein H [Butyrivibrio fibrisolvens DSM 3071]